MHIGLKIDVDTLRGTRLGVPELCRILARHEVRATFFFSVGPDNMGRHLWRLLRPRFALKMMRTRAGKLYGWDILLRGTLWPGPQIARGAGSVLRAAAAAGHEIGLHAWDHHGWQKSVERMRAREIAEHLGRGMRLLEEVTGQTVTCSAAPAWRCTDAVLREKLRFPFRYNSDCRGDGIFRPLLDDGSLGQLQVPTNLATFDERVGREGVTPHGYYEELTRALGERELNVLTVHAEVEGIATRELFERWLERTLAAGYRFVALGELVRQEREWPVARMVRGEVAGREGWVSCREQTVSPRSTALGGGAHVVGAVL